MKETRWCTQMKEGWAGMLRCRLHAQTHPPHHGMASNARLALAARRQCQPCVHLTPFDPCAATLLPGLLLLLLLPPSAYAWQPALASANGHASFFSTCAEWETKQGGGVGAGWLGHVRARYETAQRRGVTECCHSKPSTALR